MTNQSNKNSLSINKDQQVVTGCMDSLIHSTDIQSLQGADIVPGTEDTTDGP